MPKEPKPFKNDMTRLLEKTPISTAFQNTMCLSFREGLEKTFLAICSGYMSFQEVVN